MDILSGVDVFAAAAGEDPDGAPPSPGKLQRSGSAGGGGSSLKQRLRSKSMSVKKIA
jgi:hypothetical protein